MPHSYQILSIYEVVISIIGIISLVISVSVCVFFVARKERRIFKNLKKTIYLFQTGPDGLQAEHELLKENKLLFRVHDKIFNLPENPNILNTIKRKSIFVVKYSKGYERYDALVQTAKNTDSALIVLSKMAREIEDEHMALFNSHKYYDMCNSVSRLLVLIFNLAIIIPEKK